VMFSLRAFAGNFAAYRMLARIRRRLAYGRDAWLSRDLRDRFLAVERKYRDADLHSTLLDSVTRSPLPLYLRVEDRNSMAHSVEARVPFLDHRLVQLALAQDPDWKLRGPWNKYILREAMRQRIPDSVRERADKMGFPTPMSSWFKQALYEPVMDVLGSRQARERGLYDTVALRSSLELHRSGGPDVSKRLFDVVETELWFQQKIDKPQAVAQAMPLPQVLPVIAAAAS
jgi:asparagine synthase (glutamine-hydrolysing)